MNSIPFLHDLDAPIGKVEDISPLVRRIICPNPGPYTYTGTGTFIIGHGKVAVIDPGPLNDQHLKAILDATSGETISHILVTHTHADHSSLAAALSKASSAETFAFGSHGGRQMDNAEGVENGEEGVDMAFTPDHKLNDGDKISGDDWNIEAIHTPGHTSNHMCFALKQENTLFSGDHVMGWSTSIVIPPDGDMAQYMKSVERLMAQNYQCIRPTHGPAIIEPRLFLEALLAHRMEREMLVLKAVVAGHEMVSDIVKTVYIGLPVELHKAAGMSALAHLILLVNDGRVNCDDKPSMDSRFYIG